ncbi:hypothetical protein F2Q69_00003567 [Brassica cretica]|uniref:Uncharacterized protein n=1 Tax=Brassica cretica TaxID=69181 RepID=A0A8S9P067_BRACR|nr:hypothetical protein F2Q69_00003567 [Brassica cretica]
MMDEFPIRGVPDPIASARDPSQLSTQTTSASARIPDGLRSRSDVRDSIGATRPIPARVSDQLQSARVQLAVSTHPTIKTFPISSCPARGQLAFVPVRIAARGSSFLVVWFQQSSRLKGNSKSKNL